MSDRRRYAVTIELADPNRSHTRLIEWTGANRRVLDVGCGRGYVGRVLAQQFGCKVWGVEADAEAARACIAYEQVFVGSADDEAILAALPGPFDVILCGDVLEHLVSPEVTLKALHSLVTSDGYLLVSLPNIAHMRIRFRLLRGQWEYTREGIMDRTHLHFYTLATARRLFAEGGWRETQMDFIVGPNFGRALHRLRFPKRLLLPTAFATQFIFRLEPNPS